MPSLDFATIYNNAKDYPTTKDVADKLGMAYQTVKNTASMMRKKFAEGKSTTNLIMRNVGKRVGDIEIEEIETPEEPIADLIARAIVHNEKKAEYANRRNIVDINLHVEGPFGIVGLPDQHLNNPGTQLRKAMQDADIIANTEGLYCIAVGDWLDNFIIGRLERERRGDKMSHDDANRLQEYYITLIANKMLAAIGGNHCLDDQTQALTRSGWKSYWELLDTDEVLGIDPEYGNSVWQSINQIIIEPNATGSLKALAGKSVSLRCTEGHRVLHSKRKTSSGESGTTWNDLEFKKFSDVAGGRIRIPVSAKSNGAGVDLSDEQLTLAGLVLTDGCISKKGNHTRVSISQRFSNSEVVQQALIDCGYVFDRRERQRHIKEVCGRALVKAHEIEVEFRLDATESRRFISEIMYQKETMPDWAYDLDERQFNIFLKALIEGDGSFHSHTDDSFTFYNRKPLIDELQALCVMNGYSASVSEYRDGDWRLNICKRSFIEFDYRKNDISIPYDRKVWCVNVKHGNFMIRRDGKAHFTGNSDWPIMLGGSDPLGELFHRLGKQGIYDADEMRVRLNLPSGHNFIHLVRHIFPGHSKYNTGHGVLSWMLDRWQGEVCLWGGHIHSACHLTIEREHLGDSMVVHGMQLSTYKTEDKYAISRGFRKNSPFIAPVIIHVPETGKTMFFEDIEEGVAYLKFLRKCYFDNKALAA